jgi:uncharacterized protein (DUF433 family)
MRTSIQKDDKDLAMSTASSKQGDRRQDTADELANVGGAMTSPQGVARGMPSRRCGLGASDEIVHNVAREYEMPTLNRITRDPRVMGGKPCIRGMRVTVGMVVGLVASGRTHDEILREYPYLELDDIAQALSYAAWRAEEIEVPLGQP